MIIVPHILWLILALLVVTKWFNTVPQIFSFSIFFENTKPTGVISVIPITPSKSGSLIELFAPLICLWKSNDFRNALEQKCHMKVNRANLRFCIVSML